MLNTDGRHPGVREYADRFDYEHLPEGLPREVSATFHQHAQQLLDLLPDSPALTSALHKLWDAKNESVFLAVRTAKSAG